MPDDGGHRAVDLVDTPELEIAANEVAERRLVAHLGRDLLEQVAGMVGIDIVADIDADGGIANATARVGDAGDGAERHDMHGAVAGAQADGADRQVLDRSGQSGHRDGVTDLDHVFQQQEQAGDDILHQLL